MKQEIDYKGLFEEYKDMTSNYCIAFADIPIRLNDEGFYLDGDLKDSLYIFSGSFDSDYVSQEILEGEFPFDNVNKEGFWHFEFLLQAHRGDCDEPSYMELLHTEQSFCISFADQEKQEKESENFELDF